MEYPVSELREFREGLTYKVINPTGHNHPVGTIGKCVIVHKYSTLFALLQDVITGRQQWVRVNYVEAMQDLQNEDLVAILLRSNADGE